MYPVIHIFGFHIATYSLMMALGVIAFFITFLLITRKKDIERTSFDRMIIISVGGLAVIYASAFLFNSLFHSIESGKIVFGGITWLGGVIGVIPYMIFMFHKFVPQAKGRAVEFFSYVVPGIVIGHALGRIGCFFGGCCYGTVTDSIFGVVFPEGSSAAHLYPAEGGGSLPVYPTQLFEAVFEALLFLFMIGTRKKLLKYDAEIYMVAYGVFRFAIEFLRGDDRGSTGFFLTPAQVFSVIMVIAGVLIILEERGILFKKLHAKRMIWQAQSVERVKELTDLRAEMKQIDGLKEFYMLKKKGIITEEEFNEKKKELLKKI